MYMYPPKAQLLQVPNTQSECNPVAELHGQVQKGLLLFLLLHE